MSDHVEGTAMIGRTFNLNAKAKICSIDLRSASAGGARIVGVMLMERNIRHSKKWRTCQAVLSIA